MIRTTPCAWLAAGCITLLSTGCSNHEQLTLNEEVASTGAAQLELTLGDAEVDEATAVLSRPSKPEFEQKAQTLDVRGKHGKLSLLFNDLPVGPGYSIVLSAGRCGGSADFAVEPAATTLVEVTLTCTGAAPSAQVSMPPRAAPDAGATPAAEIMASAPEPGDGAVCAADCGPPASAAAAPEAAQPSAATLCGACTVAFCSPQLAAVKQHRDAVAPILACVLGDDWPAAERASASRCANSDVLGCYCGSVSPFACSNSAPLALDGQCRDVILAGSLCSDSFCVQSKLLSADLPSGIALQYVQCQQDFCYDLCFNP